MRNVEKYRKAWQATDDIIWRMRIACWITRATDPHSEYVMGTNIVFALQQCLHERVTM